jgi:hypothetical protein
MASLSNAVPVPELVLFLTSEVATGLARNVGNKRRPIDLYRDFSLERIFCSPRRGNLHMMLEYSKYTR